MKHIVDFSLQCHCYILRYAIFFQLSDCATGGGVGIVDVGLVSLCGLTSVSSKKILSADGNHRIIQYVFRNYMHLGFVDFLQKLLNQQSKHTKTVIAALCVGLGFSQ